MSEVELESYADNNFGASSIITKYKRDDLTETGVKKEGYTRIL